MAFEAWAIVEIMGHQVVAGKVSEETHFGAPLMRVDVPKTTKRETFTVYYGGGAIYKITPTTEEIANAFVEKQDPEPVKPYMLALPSLVEKVEVSSRFGDDESDYDDVRNIYDEDGDDDDEGFGETFPRDDDDEDLDEYDDEDEDDEMPLIKSPSRRDDLAERNRIARTVALYCNEPFVVLDTETTGFDPSDEIIQIAVVDQDGATVLNSYIKPAKPISNSEYHDITDDTVKDAPSFADLYPKIREALHGKVVLIYNRDYDMRMLRQDTKRHELETIEPADSACVMLWYADFRGEWDEYHRNNRWQKLDAAMSQLKLEREGSAYDALSDCKATLAVVKAVAAWKPEEKTEEKQPDSRF